MSLSYYQQRSRQMFGDLGGVSDQQRQAVRSLVRRKKDEEKYSLLDSLARKVALDQRDKQTLQSVMTSLKLGNISASDNEKIKALQNKIGNQQTSLAATGKPDTVADDRNIVEKTLNLHPHQNAFFDVLQVLGRPQQALYNAVDSGLQGKNPLEGAYQGITGHKETSGDQLLGKYAGMDKGLGRSVLGFGVDVLADPLNLVGGGLGRNLAKGTPILDKASQKIGETFYNKVPFGVGKTLGNAFGLGKSIDLHGNYTNALNQLDQSGRAIRDYHNLKTEDALKHASDLTGGNGEDISKILQLPDLNARLGKLDPASSEYQTLSNLQKEYSGLAQNPKLQQAAGHIKNNVYDQILQLGKDAGIPLDEHLGYVPRVLTGDAKQAMSEGRIPNLSTTVATNKKVLDRNLVGTVDEINSRFRDSLGGADLLESNGIKSTALGSRRLVNYLASTSFVKNVLQDPSLAVKVGADIAKPKNSVLVDVGQVLGKDNPLAGEIGGKYHITPGAADSFKNYMRLASDQDTLTQFASGVDKVHRLFKSTALFTGKYHLNNAAGNFMMQYLRGINPLKAVKYNTQAVKALVHVKSAMKKGGESLTDAEKKATQIYDDFLKQGVSSRGANGHFGEDFIQKEGETALQKRLSGGGNVLNPMTWMGASRKLGENTDEAFRLGTYLAGKSAGMDAKAAGKMVREVHLDPTNLTQFERNAMRRLIPFYTFTKKSLPFLIKHGIKNPGVLTNLGKASQAGYNATGQNENITPDYLKNSFSLPVSSDGQLNLNLPINTIPQAIDDPIKFATDQASPFFKAFADLSGGKGVGKAAQDFLPPVQRGISGYEQGGADQSIMKILGLNPVTDANQEKFTQQKLAGMSKEYGGLLQDTGAPTVTDLRKSGLVSNNQAAPNQLTQSGDLLSLAKQQGMDDTSAQQLLMLKQYIESHNPETAQQWAAFLQQKGISPDLIQMITSHPLQY